MAAAEEPTPSEHFPHKEATVHRNPTQHAAACEFYEANFETISCSDQRLLGKSNALARIVLRYFQTDFALGFWDKQQRGGGNCTGIAAATQY